MPPPDRNAPRLEPHRLKFFGICFVVVVVAVLIYGAASRAAQNSRLRELTAVQAIPDVAVTKASAVENRTGIDLPGRLEAYIRAPIYARVPGYLKSWKHDIGSKVKAGEVLAEIDTPDLDQQLLQARADLNVAQANAKLSEITAKRWQSLSGTDAVAKQDVDQRTFTYDANLAQVKAAQANVERLMAEQGFKRLIAPFDGIVTARETDIGQLINVGATGGAELFVVSETQKLRIYVNVPQNYVPSVPAGTKATIRVPEHPGKTFQGTVEASAQAVNPNSGTTLMQIIVDNQEGEMMPGDYASIHLQAAAVANVLSIPSSAVIFDAKGLSIATVGDDDKVVLKPVSIERDLGPVVEIASGLSPTDRIIQNPPDGVASGDVVRVVGAPAASKVAGAGAEKPKSDHG
ncbi:MAG TPA: efflux RND transporter periplasmic adaptor subunit [Steroidobacteraceae bacterium]|jgi:RND family efflux transporter MFP subunit